MPHIDSSGVLVSSSTAIIKIQFLFFAEQCLDHLLGNDMPLAGSGMWPVQLAPVDVFPFLRYLPSWFLGGVLQVNICGMETQNSNLIHLPEKTFVSNNKFAHLISSTSSVFLPVILPDHYRSIRVGRMICINTNKEMTTIGKLLLVVISLTTGNYAGLSPVKK
jgi:hypothetical protein